MFPVVSIPLECFVRAFVVCEKQAPSNIMIAISLPNCDELLLTTGLPLMLFLWIKLRIPGRDIPIYQIPCGLLTDMLFTYFPVLMHSFNGSFKPDIEEAINTHGQLTIHW